ncbi:hypothetical protein CDD81_2480 [Ophiocordyceps australis]|uniref:Uncharacterized protein n=1 Tax=Ophiocordyceps australis TaxID=1399860 RepID=A0A2C5YCE1_9HYPO|nr:hypothetical protein CDD81_2480 [Ophiocordyceps australis]
MPTLPHPPSLLTSRLAPTRRAAPCWSPAARASTQKRSKTSSQLQAAEAHDAALRAARARRVEAARGMKSGESEREYRKRYNRQAFRWTSGMIAMPIALVTSYYLFGRLFFGKEVKVLPKTPEDWAALQTGKVESKTSSATNKAVESSR